MVTVAIAKQVIGRFLSRLGLVGEVGARGLLSGTYSRFLYVTYLTYGRLTCKGFIYSTLHLQLDIVKEKVTLLNMRPSLKPSVVFIFICYFRELP